VRQAASRTHAEGLGGASLELLQMVCEALDHVAMARDPLRRGASHDLMMFWFLGFGLGGGV
jgi:hypothetical protein